MTSDNHTQNREIQRDARAWAAFTRTRYTAALRQMRSPLAQGLLGERVSARHLIAVLENHELIGARGGDLRLDENGFLSSAVPWRFNGETDFIELALVTDMLRMFAPISDSVTPDVSSYALKHTAEEFLRPHCSYVSNGRVIWAAAALGLPLIDPDGSGPNLLIGVPEREHDYVRRMTSTGWNRPKADHHRPAGYAHLQTALARAAAGEQITDGWVRPTPVTAPSPFHDWLILQAGRDDSIGDLASDYAAGVRDSDHNIARIPDDLLTIFHQVSHSPEAYDAVVSAIATWMTAEPSAPPVRTARISGGEHHHPVRVTGAEERYEYRCPCGDGEIIEDHDNTPGFQEHEVWIACNRCRAEWRLVASRPVRNWGLVPVAVSILN